MLVYREIEFPPTHDIRQLLMLLDESGSTLPEWLWEAVLWAEEVAGSSGAEEG